MEEVLEPYRIQQDGWIPPPETTNEYDALIYASSIGNDDTQNPTAHAEVLCNALGEAKWIATQILGVTTKAIKANPPAERILKELVDCREHGSSTIASRDEALAESQDRQQRLQNLMELFDAHDPDDDWLHPLLLEHFGKRMLDKWGNHKRDILRIVCSWAARWIQIRLRYMLDAMRYTRDSNVDWGGPIGVNRQKNWARAGNRSVHRANFIDDAILAFGDVWAEETNFNGNNPSPPFENITRIGYMYREVYGVHPDFGWNLSAYAPNHGEPRKVTSVVNTNS